MQQLQVEAKAAKTSTARQLLSSWVRQPWKPHTLLASSCLRSWLSCMSRCCPGQVAWHTDPQRSSCNRCSLADLRLCQ